MLFWHITAVSHLHRKSYIYSRFVCPVYDSPGNTDTNLPRAHHCCQQLSHMTFVKSFLFPETILLFKGSCASSTKAIGCSLMCLVGSLQRRPQICSPTSGISTWEHHRKEQGLCSPGHISVGVWIQIQEVGGTWSLLLPIRSHPKLDNTWPFITMCLICPGLTVFPYTIILL